MKKLGLWKPGVQGRNPTYDRTGRLFRQGLSIEEIARRRGLAEGTIVSHFEFLARSGEELDLERHLPHPEQREKITAAFRELGGWDAALKPVREMVGEDCSYEEIRLVRMSLRRQDPLPAAERSPEESPSPPASGD